MVLFWFFGFGFCSNKCLNCHICVKVRGFPYNPKQRYFYYANIIMKCLISPWGQFWERLCTRTSAVMYAWVLLQNPFQKLVSMAKLHSLTAALIKFLCTFKTVRKLVKFHQLSTVQYHPSEIQIELMSYCNWVKLLT